ncbi:MAG TPA: allantoicase [Vicinamibacterales bacterium]|nr:allantoicase [Vicinamibacterales bacterium]
MSEFTHLIDLASARLGGQAIAANDDFFAEKENLIKPEPPVFIPGKYTDRGKWMDGWESRRRRTPGHDWCIVKLGVPGVVHAFIVDTAFFTGNYPTHCWIDGCGLPEGADAAAPDVEWHPVLARSELGGDTQNTFTLRLNPRNERRFTHLRLNIFPDGGVARLRVMGESLPDWSRVLAGGKAIDLAAAIHGGYVVDTSDRFYGEPRNMLMPYRAANMGDGWETKRRRGPGHDWAIVRLGLEAAVAGAEVDTAHFKGNYPDSASIEAALIRDEGKGVSADVAARAIAHWAMLLAPTRLRADHRHVFGPDVAPNVVASHVRLNIFPDGGVSRFRVHGVPVAEARRAAVLRQLNAMDAPELRALLADFCAAPAWIERVALARPFASADAVFAAADAAGEGISMDDWREAFRHHPRIGERGAEKRQSDAARAMSSEEQQAAAAAEAPERAALAEANLQYEQRFGHVFIVSAAGRSAGEILALIRQRMPNDPAAELAIAAAEQRAITRLRLERVLG